MLKRFQKPKPILKPEPLSSQQVEHLTDLRSTLQSLQTAPRPEVVMIARLTVD